MKAVIPLVALLLLVACKKEDRSIKYDLSCFHCSARYLDADGVSRYIKITPDTTFTETDTIVEPGPKTWSTSFDVQHDAQLYFGVARLSVLGAPTIATRTIDGHAESRTTTLGGDHMVFE